MVSDPGEVRGMGWTIKQGVGRSLIEKVRFSQDLKEVGASDADVGGVMWIGAQLLRASLGWEGLGKGNKTREAGHGVSIRDYHQDLSFYSGRRREPPAVLR